MIGLGEVNDVDHAREDGYEYVTEPRAGATMTTCTKDRTSNLPKAVANLHTSQGGEWRHGGPARADETDWREVSEAYQWKRDLAPALPGATS